MPLDMICEAIARRVELVSRMMEPPCKEYQAKNRQSPKNRMLLQRIVCCNQLQFHGLSQNLATKHFGVAYTSDEVRAGLKSLRRKF